MQGNAEFQKVRAVFNPLELPKISIPPPCLALRFAVVHQSCSRSNFAFASFKDR